MGREERERKEEDRPFPLVHVSNAHAASHSPQSRSWLRRSTSLPQELLAPNELILILPLFHPRVCMVRKLELGAGITNET